MAKSPARFPVHHGTDLKALLAACHASFDDDTPRLVLADWLQEHDDPRGELVRLQCQISALPAGAPEYDAMMTRHEKWWRAHQKLWEREAGWMLYDRGPHDRGLPTLGHYEDEDNWFNTDDVGDPAKNPKDRLSQMVAEGWFGMTWVLPMAFAEFDDFELDLDDEDDVEELVRRAAGDDDPYTPFREPPWAGSPTPVGLTFAEGMAVTPELIDQAAALPNLRGLSLYETVGGPELVPHIAKLTGLTHLDLDRVRLGDREVRMLAPLGNLRALTAGAATFTNVGAADLARQFPELRELRVGTRRLTGPGFQSLAALAKLEVLTLAHANDKAVRALAPLVRLRRLGLSNTAVTGAGVENFPLLTELHLGSSRASDAGLSGLDSLVRLRSLEVEGTAVTGATLARVAGLKWLDVLGLSECAIRDRDTVHLEGLKRLDVLTLRGTKVTKARLAALKAKLKGTAIY